MQNESRMCVLAKCLKTAELLWHMPSESVNSNVELGLAPLVW